MRSIQSLIFIRLFGIILIFFVVVSALTYVLTAEAIKQFVVSDATTSLSFIVNNIETNYKSELTGLDQIASLPGFLPFDPEQSEKFIKEFLALPNIFTTVHMYKVDGQLVFAVRRLPTGSVPYRPKENFNEKEPGFIALAKRVIAEKRSLASQTFFTWAQGAPYQTYVTPVFEDRSRKRVLGILSGGVFPRLKKLDYLLQGLKLGKDNFILITDSRGNFITSDGITERAYAHAIKEQTNRAARKFYDEANPSAHDAQTALVNERLAVGEAAFIALSLPIPELKLVVTLGVNRLPLDHKIRQLSNRLFVALIVGLLLSLFASVFVGERLAKPFRDMARTINDINIGNFSARTSYKGEDEIGYLSERINTLAMKIQKSEYLGNLWSNEEEEALEPGTKSKES